MDASGDARVRGTSLPRVRLQRHSSIADALDIRPPVDQPRPRVAGARANRTSARDDPAAMNRARPVLGARYPHIALSIAGAASRAHRSTPGSGRTTETAADPEHLDQALPDDSEPDAETDLLPWHDADDESAGARTSSSTRRTIIIASVAAVLVALGVVSQVISPKSSPSQKPPAQLGQGALAPPSAATAPIDDAEAWIAANLAPGTALTAQQNVAATLKSDGFAAHPFTTAGRWGTDSVLVSTPSIRRLITRSLTASAARTGSLPVAVFGTDAERIEVLLIVPDRAAALKARMKRDADDRVMAGRALLSNPLVTADSRPHALLRAGELDMRAMTVLALLATKTDVHVTRIAFDSAEVAADRPARTVLVSLRDPTALADVLRVLSPIYTPSHVTRLAANAPELTWSVGLAPDRALN